MKNNKYFKSVIYIALLILLFFIAKDNVSAAYSIFSQTDDEYTKISADYKNMNENIKNKKLYEEKLRDISDDAYNFNIMKNIRQEQILTILNEFLSISSVEASSIKFSEISDEKADDEVESALVSVSFTASYNNMLKFIDEIQVCRTGASIKSVRFVMNDNDEFYGTIDIVFYALKMDEAYE
ncbi:MAG: hypothetical protein VB128_10950 [Sedimentibacter saalensis]|uniref:hypothetical protein n=1 Tax=Sedimentibacter saalensis TaxID=130788 RepID=UPI002B205729|nr:hypothetical protein [Sedimentibacter saalensis]MEA5095462.1 hypothetical protein [Sedimentibacter saalensis]